MNDADFAMGERKCEACGASQWIGPTFRDEHDWGYGLVQTEALQWKCVRCGFAVERPTLRVEQMRAEAKRAREERIAKLPRWRKILLLY